MIALLKRLFAAPSRSIEVRGGTCYVYGINYRPLYGCLCRLPGVACPRKPHYFWTGLGVYAEVVLRGHTFQIQRDPWDEALCISPKDGLTHPEELREFQEHLERWLVRWLKRKQRVEEMG